jgi:dipeptidyl aminopeptidase/acylaminoacyl peptidase
MHSRKHKLAAYWVTASLVLLAASGCGLSSGNAREEIVIPSTQAGPAADLGLGPGVRPLSFGPGVKSSPRISPSGERVAFILDGYLVEKPLYTQDFHHRTTPSEVSAEVAEWLPDESLAVLGSEEEDIKTTLTPSSLFVAQREDSSSDDLSTVRKLSERVGAASSAPGSQLIVTAVVVSPTEEAPEELLRSRLMLLWGSGEPVKVYLSHIEGYVTSLSVSPDGRGAVMAVRRGAEGQRQGQYEVLSYRFSEGQPRHVANVPDGMEVLGAPQWTQEGEVYFVAGETNEPGETAGAPVSYVLYKVTPDSAAPVPVRTLGEGFVAASISVSPDGNRLAVLGRRNPGSPTNLYTLDLTSDTLEAATSNENMEIKTNPRDLAWSPDGQSVVLVARGAFSGPKVYDAPPQSLSSAFYNLYEVPVGSPANAESEG